MPGRHRLARPSALDRWDPALHAAATATETALGALFALGAIALLVGSAVATLGALGAATAPLGAAALGTVPFFPPNRHPEVTPQ